MSPTSLLRNSTLVFLTLTLTLLGGCSGKKSDPLLWLLLGAGGGASESGRQAAAVDANGESLPENTGTPAPEGIVPQSSGAQEVATSGPAQITGSIVAISGTDGSGNPTLAEDVCGLSTAPAPPNCVDYTSVTVQLVASNGTVVATTNLNADGSFQINVEDLPNNNYRVLIENGNGLNYAYEDINFVYDPTSQDGITLVDVGTIQAEREYYNEGPALISGIVQTPGFVDGTVTVNSGPLSGVRVELIATDGTVIATETTNSSGEYSFNPSNLTNGNYIVRVYGSEKSDSGRPFQDLEQSVRFTFQGNDPSIATEVTVPTTSLEWQAADSSSITLTGTVNNAAVAGDTTTVYSIQLTDSSGSVVASTTQTGSGAYELNASGLTGGVYSVQVVGTVDGSPVTFPSTQSFVFTPHPSGGNREITGMNANVVARPSEVVGRVQHAGTHINGSVINFRPAATQPPINLLYLLQDDSLRDMIVLWLSQANTAIASNCVATGNLTSACIMTHQGTGAGVTPGEWGYSTYANKVYEVRPDNSVYFEAVAGTWAYYISAPGFENYCNGGGSSCPDNPMVLTLNGQNHDAGTIAMTPSDRRSQIAGSITVRDRILVDGTRNGTVVSSPNDIANMSGLFIILLGNTDASGNPVVHITQTGAGGFSFGGASKVVTLPPGITSDEARVGIAINSFVGAEVIPGAPVLSAPLLGSATSVTSTTVGHPVHQVGTGSSAKFNFRQSSYQILVVDPLGHTSPASFSADNSGVATTDYATTPTTLNLARTINHLPRRQILGNVFNAISTAGVGTATILIGRPGANGEFVADVRRDCNDGNSNDYVCSVPSIRNNGNDQTLVGPTTESNGDFLINNINPGDYILRITGEGFQDQDIAVTVPSTGSVPNVNIPLVPNSGFGNLAGSVRLPGGHDFTGSYSLELVHPTSGNRPTGGVQPSSLASGFASYSNVPNYTIFQVNAGQWKVRFVSAGYKTVEGLVNIQKDATTNFDIITMVPGSDPPASIVGRAINAITNNNSGMQGLTVRIRPGVNVTSGPLATAIDGTTVLPAVTTAADGSFAINQVPPGNYTLEVTGAGVATAYRTVVSAGSSTPSSQNILVSPVLQTDEMRIVLSWNATPRDLDSHLEFGSGRPNQVVWNDRNKLGGDAILDVDVVNGYGPETVTLKGSAWTQARLGYSVYNWSRECTNRNWYGSCTRNAELNESGAVVRVYRSNGLVRSYSVNPNHSGRWWQIFCLNSDKSITDVGRGSCRASDFFNASHN